MKHCPNCGAENDESIIFCTECGKKLKTNTTENNEVVTEEKKELFNEVSVSTNMKKTNNKIIKIVAVLALLGGLITFGTVFANNLLIDQDPIKKLLYGFNKVYSAEELEYVLSTKLKIKGLPDEGAMYAKMIEDLEIKSYVKCDKEEKQIDFKLEFLFDENVVADVELYGDDEYLFIKVPMIYEEAFYIKWDEIDQLINNYKAILGVEAPSIQFDKYMKLFNTNDSEALKKLDKNKYIEKIKELLENRISNGEDKEIIIIERGKERKVRCSALIINISYDDYVDIFTKIYVQLLEDENIRAFIMEKYDEFCVILKETEDYKELGIVDFSDEKIEANKKDIEEGIDKIIEEFKLQIQEMEKLMKNEQMNMSGDLSYKIYQDSARLPRKITANQKFTYETEVVDEITELEVISEITIHSIKDVNINKFAPTEKDINVSVMTIEEWEKIMEDITYNLTKAFMMNPIFQEILMGTQNVSGIY